MRFWTAWQLLTIIPIPYCREYPPENLGKSIGFFPVVGIFLGAGLLGLDLLLRLFLPLMLVNILLLVVLLILTGALHLDGFIDTCDGLAIRGLPPARLEAMHDSRVGAFGVIGGCLMLLAQFASLMSLPSGLRTNAFLLMPVLSRWAMVYAICAFPSAKKEGMGWQVKQGATWKGMAIATGISSVIALVSLRWWGLALLAALALIVFVFARFLCSRLGGLSGDSYGAINEFTQLAVLILVYIIANYASNIYSLPYFI